MTPNTYVPTTWVDEVPASSPLKYSINGDVEGEISASAQIDLATAIATPGTPLNATNLNHIEQGLLTVQNQANLLEPAAARMRHSFAVPDDTITKVPFSVKTFDPLSLLTTGANARFTVPQDGIYDVKVILDVLSATWGAGDQLSVSPGINGTIDDLVLTGALFRAGAAGTGTFRVANSDLAQLTEDWYIEVFIYHNFGSSVNVNVYLAIAKV